MLYNLNTTKPSTLIASGQGFFVATKTSGFIAFTRDMYYKGSSDDFSLGRYSTFENMHLKLELSLVAEIYNTDFYFNENLTLALDIGYDAGVSGNTAPNFLCAQVW